MLEEFTQSIQMLAGYRNNSKYWERQARANSIDQDQTPRDAASDQGLHSLPLVQIF